MFGGISPHAAPTKVPTTKRCPFSRILELAGDVRQLFHAYREAISRFFDDSERSAQQGEHFHGGLGDLSTLRNRVASHQDFYDRCREVMMIVNTKTRSDLRRWHRGLAEGSRGQNLSDWRLIACLPRLVHGTEQLMQNVDSKGPFYARYSDLLSVAKSLNNLENGIGTALSMYFISLAFLELRCRRQKLSFELTALCKGAENFAFSMSAFTLKELGPIRAAMEQELLNAALGSRKSAREANKMFTIFPEDGVPTLHYAASLRASKGLGCPARRSFIRKQGVPEPVNVIRDYLRSVSEMTVLLVPYRRFRGTSS